MNNFFRFFLQKNRLASGIFISGIFLAVLGLFTIANRQKTALSPDKLVTCITSPYGRYTADAYCLERVVGELDAVYSIGDVLKYLIAPTTPMGVQVYAHTIAHFGGKQLFLKTGSVEAALGECTPGPWYGYGCVHGVIGAAVANELGVGVAEAADLSHADSTTIEVVAKKYCARGSFQLCHAVGHILFQVFSDFKKIPELCDRATTDSVKREACARGAFMEGAGPVGSLSPREKSLMSAADYRGSCGLVPPPYQHACFWYLPWAQSLLFERDAVDSVSERLAISKDECAEFTGVLRAHCIESIGLNAEGMFRDDDRPNRKYFCDSFDDGVDKQACVLGVVESFLNAFNFTGGAKYCYTTINPSLQDFCYRALFRIAEQISTGPEMKSICDEKLISRKCNEELESYLDIKSTVPNYVFGLYGDRR